jgi:hypothetical protein
MTKLNLVESSKVVGGGLCDRYNKQVGKSAHSAWARRRVDSMARRRNVSHCLRT